MYGVSEDQKSIVQMVRQFATESLAPHAAEWDETHYFPIEVLRQAGELGMGVSTPEKNSVVPGLPAPTRC